jgi:hypothetical protein
MLVFQLDGPTGRHHNQDGIGTTEDEAQHSPCALTVAQERIVTIEEKYEKK